MKIIKESKVRPPKKYNLNLDESLFEARSNKIKVGSLVTHKDDNPRTRGTVASLKGNTAKVMVGDPANNDYVEVPLDDLELDESKLTEASNAPIYDEPTNMGRGQCAPLVTDLASRLKEAIRYLSDTEEAAYAKRIINNCIERLMYDKESVENFNKYWTERYPACIKYIEDQLALIPDEFKLVGESLTEATTHAMPNSMKMGKKSGESFAVVVAVDQLKYKEEEGLDRTSAFTKAATLSRAKPTAYVAVISSDDPRLAEFNSEKPNDKDANGQTVTQESLITEDSDIPVETQSAPEIGPEFGLASMLNTAIQDEWKTIDMYNSLSVTASTEGYEDIAGIIDEINTEESKHVGQLQAALKTVAPNARAINDGEREGEAQLNSNSVDSNPLD